MHKDGTQVWCIWYIPTDVYSLSNGENFDTTTVWEGEGRVRCDDFVPSWSYPRMIPRALGSIWSKLCEGTCYDSRCRKLGWFLQVDVAWGGWEKSQSALYGLHCIGTHIKQGFTSSRREFVRNVELNIGGESGRWSLLVGLPAGSNQQKWYLLIIVSK